MHQQNPLRNNDLNFNSFLMKQCWIIILLSLKGFMCYLPMPLLKTIVGVGAVISMLISGALLAVTIYANFEKKDIIDNTDENQINGLLVGLYIISILFLMLAFCGVYGSIKARRKNSKLGNCLLTVYFVGVAVFLLTFIAISIALFVAPSSIFGQNCEKGSKTLLVPQLYNLNNIANDEFCTNDCPCYIKSDNTNSYLAEWLDQKNRTYSNDSKKSFKNYQSCMNDTENEGNAILMSTLEKVLDCAGWCHNDSPKFNKFTDINYCVTQKCIDSKLACYDEFKNFMVAKGNKMGVWSVIASAICMLNMISICCICYHPANRGRKRQNFYARMMEAD